MTLPNIDKKLFEQFLIKSFPQIASIDITRVSESLKAFMTCNIPISLRIETIEVHKYFPTNGRMRIIIIGALAEIMNIQFEFISLEAGMLFPVKIIC